MFFKPPYYMGYTGITIFFALLYVCIIKYNICLIYILHKIKTKKKLYFFDTKILCKIDIFDIYFALIKLITYHCISLTIKTISMNKIEKIGQKIREARKGLNLSTKEVGKKTNTTQQYVCLIELGRHNPTLTKLDKLADAVGLSVDVVPKTNNNEDQNN